MIFSKGLSKGNSEKRTLKKTPLTRAFSTVLGSLHPSMWRVILHKLNKFHGNWIPCRDIFEASHVLLWAFEWVFFFPNL